MATNDKTVSAGVNATDRVDGASLVNLSRDHLGKIIKALELEQQKADVTELIKSAQRSLVILGRCATNFGELSGTNVKAIENIYNEICKYEKKIESLTSMGTLVRVITQARMRSKLDQNSNYICVQVETLERHIREVKVSQFVDEFADEFTSMLDEIEKMHLSSEKNKNEFKLRRSMEQQKKVKDEDVKNKLDSILSIVKDSSKKSALMSQIYHLNVKPTTTDNLYSILSIDESERLIQDWLCVRSVSTYPRDLQGIREGDPIADQYAIARIDNRVISALADGCSWGVEPKEAARKASRMFVSYLKRHNDLIQSTQDAADFILRSYEAAHRSIVYGRNEENLFLAGTTTMCAGILLELVNPEQGKPFAFVCASIGDCKGYSYNPKTDKISEFTIGNRGGIDARDPGGRLGPTLQDGSPDLRNLKLYCHLCEESDIIILVSDGVHDNIDPRQLGKKPSEIGIIVNPDSWDKVKEEKSNDHDNKISEWSEKYLNNLISTTKPVTVASINRCLIKNSMDITKSMRNFMEQNPGKRVPPDYLLYPGKVDHTTCIAFKVGNRSGNNTNNSIGSPSSWTTAKVIPSSNTAKRTFSKEDINFTNNDILRKDSMDDSNDPYTSVWDKIFSTDSYVIPWKQFIEGLGFPIDENSEKQLKTILDYSNTGSVTRFKFGEFLKGFGPTLSAQCLKNVNAVVNAE